jgi:pyridoxamine 5'-phosphate oxidase
MQPFDIFSQWYTTAQQVGLKEPTAVNLATATPQGLPSNRTVLLKAWDERGFVIFTNHHSRKAQQLEKNPHASLCFYWMPLMRQVRIEGTVEATSNAESDDYFASRSRDSQLGAWASLQSSVMPKASSLQERFEQYQALYAGKDVPRPPHWGGFRVIPEMFEFWEERPHRMHQRDIFLRDGESWRKENWYP